MRNTKRQMFNRLGDQAGYDTVNKEGAPAFEMSTAEALLQCLMTNTVEGSYYVGKQDLAEQSIRIHSAALGALPKDEYAQAIKYARNEGYMRLQPILGLVSLSTEAFGGLPFGYTKLFIDVCRTPKDVKTFIDLCQSSAVAGRTGLSDKLKRTIRKWLKHKLSEYWAIKYRNELKIIIKLTHPSPLDMVTPDHTKWAIVQWIINDTWKWDAETNKGVWLSTTHQEVHDIPNHNIPQLYAYDMLKQGRLPMSRAIDQGRLPYEAIVGVAKPSTEEWIALAHQMPIFALTRHLVTLFRHQCYEHPELVEMIIRKLTSQNIVSRSKMFPHHFYQAYVMLGREAQPEPDRYTHWDKQRATSLDVYPRQRVLDALLTACKLSVSNIPPIPGRTLIAIDTSGSMTGYPSNQKNQILSYMDIASLFGGALFKQTTGDSVVWGFDTEVHCFMFAPSQDLFEIINEVKKYEGGGTSLEAPLAQALADKAYFDTFIGITDSMEWASAMLANRVWHQYRGIKGILTDYRKQINTNLKAIFLRIDPYDTKPTRDHPNDYYIYGWSDIVPRLCSYIVSGDARSQWEQVKQVEL